MKGIVDWRGGRIETLDPWRRETAVVAWIGPLPDVSLPPSAAEQADADGLPERARPGFLRRRAALRRCVARWTGQPPEAVVIACDAHRRPVVRWPEGGFKVSTASRADLVAVGLACDPLGIDVEVATGVADAIAPAVLTAAEARDLAALPPGKREEGFLTLWTAKEAYLKAIGLGLSRDPATIGIAMDPNGRVVVTDAGRPVRGLAAETHGGRIGDHAVRAACAILR